MGVDSLAVSCYDGAMAGEPVGLILTLTFTFNMTYTKKATKKKEYGPSPEEKLCERLIQVIEAGVNPWRKQWQTRSQGRHRNLITGDNYHGSNPMMLEFQSAFAGYSLPLWCGAAQAKKMNWFPKKGSHGSYVLRPQMNAYEMKDENGNTLLKENGEASINSWVSYKTACVFNAEALKGVDEEAEAALQAEIAKQIGNIIPKTDNERIEKAHDVLNHWKAEGAEIVSVTFAGDKAFYVPSLDKITIPPIEYFDNSESFYATWCHEAIHSTGHPDRLKREISGSMSSDKYAREELVAEMGAFILSDRLEIGSDVQNHAAYLEGWLKVLKQGPKALFKAVGDANKGANMIYAEQMQTDETEA